MLIPSVKSPSLKTAGKILLEEESMSSNHESNIENMTSNKDNNNNNLTSKKKNDINNIQIFGKNAICKKCGRQRSKKDTPYRWKKHLKSNHKYKCNQKNCNNKKNH